MNTAPASSYKGSANRRRQRPTVPDERTGLPAQREAGLGDQGLRWSEATPVEGLWYLQPQWHDEESPALCWQRGLTAIPEAAPGDGMSESAEEKIQKGGESDRLPRSD